MRAGAGYLACVCLWCGATEQPPRSTSRACHAITGYGSKKKHHPTSNGCFYFPKKTDNKTTIPKTEPLLLIFQNTIGTRQQGRLWLRLDAHCSGSLTYRSSGPFSWSTSASSSPSRWSARSDTWSSIGTSPSTLARSRMERAVSSKTGRHIQGHSTAPGSKEQGSTPNIGDHRTWFWSFTASTGMFVLAASFSWSCLSHLAPGCSSFPSPFDQSFISSSIY